MLCVNLKYFITHVLCFKISRQKYRLTTIICYLGINWFLMFMMTSFEFIFHYNTSFSISIKFLYLCWPISYASSISSKTIHFHRMIHIFTNSFIVNVIILTHCHEFHFRGPELNFCCIYMTCFNWILKIEVLLHFMKICYSLGYYYV